MADYCGERCKEQQGERRFSQEANGNEPRKDAPRSGWMDISNSTGSQQGIKAAAPARHWGSVESAGGIDWVYCRDNKYRPIESGILPLAHGVPRGMVHSSNPNASQEARKMRLHGYGNAIVPQVAAEFITAFMEIK